MMRKPKDPSMFDIKHYIPFRRDPEFRSKYDGEVPGSGQ